MKPIIHFIIQKGLVSTLSMYNLSVNIYNKITDSTDNR